MIQVTNLSFSYSNKHNNQWILENINLKIHPGERYVIIGPSGCGKSTLLLLLSGLLQPVRGSIYYNNTNNYTVNKNTSILFQNSNLFPWKTVLDNVLLGSLLQNHNKKRAKDIALKYLDLLGMKEEINKYPAQLSGGQVQRVALARALSTKPKFLLMDEPFSALDNLLREELQQLVYSLWNKLNFTLIIVTHNIEEAVFLGTKIIILSKCPAQIIQIVKNNLNTKESLKARNSPEFFSNCTYIRNFLYKEGSYNV